MSRIYFAIFCLWSAWNVTGQKTDLSLVFDRSFEIPNSSVRAIETTGESGLWFAGSGGIYGLIRDDAFWLDSIEHEGAKPNFRSLAINGSKVFVLSIENPALLFRLPEVPGASAPTLVYREDHESVFYDSMTFLNSKDGIALGDPTDNCLSLLMTRDGGDSWAKIPCDDLPETFDGEAGFAASDSNIATFGDSIWVATGGSKARIWRSADKGEHWETFETPMVQGKSMTGIFSLDFSGPNEGIIMGGNWEDKDNGSKTKALTRDGGKTWVLVSEGKMPGYISCVQYLPGSEGREIMAVSTQGVFYSGDRGLTWSKVSEEGFYSLRFENRESAWLSRNNEIVHAILVRE